MITDQTGRHKILLPLDIILYLFHELFGQYLLQLDNKHLYGILVQFKSLLTCTAVQWQDLVLD